MTSTSTLPTPRSLLNTLTLPTNTPTNPELTIDEPYSAPSNPLKSLPQSKRALLSTLHVLFPPPMLLQALDLLDRGLVTRLVEREEAPESILAQAGKEKEKMVYAPQANIHLPVSTPLSSEGLHPDQ